VLISSQRRWALMHELRGEPEASLPELLARLSPVDIVIVEGFKREPHVKIEIHRAGNGKPPLHAQDATIVAVVSDVPFPGAGRPVIDIDDVEAVADIVLAWAEPLAPLRARAGR
jgi:molybdopterin-guanine dinucleotide biosynthesis protein B